MAAMSHCNDGGLFGKKISPHGGSCLTSSKYRITIVLLVLSPNLVKSLHYEGPFPARIGQEAFGERQAALDWVPVFYRVNTQPNCLSDGQIALTTPSQYSVR